MRVTLRLTLRVTLRLTRAVTNATRVATSTLAGSNTNVFIMAKLLAIVMFGLFASVAAVLPDYSPALQRNGLTRDEVIKRYFCLGFSAKEIALFLVNVHGIRIRLRQLKRV